MAILEGIRIRNYRALKDVALGNIFRERAAPALTRLVAVIGANGTGKSSLVDALEFLGDCLKEGVEAACNKPHRGGFERLRTHDCKEPIEFEILYRQDANSAPISYALVIDCNPNGSAYVYYEALLRNIGLTEDNPKHKGLTFLIIRDGKGEAWFRDTNTEGEGHERMIPVQMADRAMLGIATLGSLANHQQIAAFRQFLSGWYLSYFVPQLARTQPMAGIAPHLDRNGENLANYVQYVERKNPDGFQTMLVRIARKIPGIRAIKSVKAPDRRLLLEFQMEGYETPFYQQDMSDGTLKMLAYLLLMEDPEPAPLIGIEEPENGLHPQLLADLAMEFKTFAREERGPQVLITTHAPNFVDALSPEEVWILDKGKDGFAQITRAADIPGVPELFAEGLPMGSLWYSDHFGIGNP